VICGDNNKERKTFGISVWPAPQHRRDGRQNSPTYKRSLVPPHGSASLYELNPILPGSGRRPAKKNANPREAPIPASPSASLSTKLRRSKIRRPRVAICVPHAAHRRFFFFFFLFDSPPPAIHTGRSSNAKRAASPKPGTLLSRRVFPAQALGQSIVYDCRPATLSLHPLFNEPFPKPTGASTVSGKIRMKVVSAASAQSPNKSAFPPRFSVILSSPLPSAKTYSPMPPPGMNPLNFLMNRRRLIMCSVRAFRHKQRFCCVQVVR